MLSLRAAIHPDSGSSLKTDGLPHRLSAAWHLGLSQSVNLRAAALQNPLTPDNWHQYDALLRHTMRTCPVPVGCGCIALIQSSLHSLAYLRLCLYRIWVNHVLPPVMCNAASITLEMRKMPQPPQMM